MALSIQRAFYFYYSLIRTHSFFTPLCTAGQRISQSSESLSTEKAAPTPNLAHATEAEIHNQTRLELFARQYVAGKLSPAEEARLAIVTERVRRLIPRVTVEDFEMLEQILQNAAEIEAEDVERRRRLVIE